LELACLELIDHVFEVGVLGDLEHRNFLQVQRWDLWLVVRAFILGDRGMVY